MITRFKLKKDAFDFANELREKGYRATMYKGHREYCVQCYDMKSDEELHQLGEV